MYFGDLAQLDNFRGFNDNEGLEKWVRSSVAVQNVNGSHGSMHVLSPLQKILRMEAQMNAQAQNVLERRIDQIKNQIAQL